MCLSDNCKDNKTPFATKLEWEKHLIACNDVLNPAKAYTCPICQSTLGSVVRVSGHLAAHMEEIALTILPTNADSEDGTDVDSGLASSSESSEDNVSRAAEGIISKAAIGVTEFSETIKSTVIDRLILDQDLKQFGKLLRGIRDKLHDDMVLRDVETLLLDGAEVHATNASNYQKFALASLEAIGKVLHRFDDESQTRSHSRPYDDEYIKDATKRVLRRAIFLEENSIEEWPKLKTDDGEETDSTQVTPQVPRNGFIRKSRANRVMAEDWDRLKDQILHLYENHKLEVVLQILEDDFSFKVT
jgi:hypothetical protein